MNLGLTHVKPLIDRSLGYNGGNRENPLPTDSRKNYIEFHYLIFHVLQGYIKP
jgi:hypothetical protein